MPISVLISFLLPSKASRLTKAVLKPLNGTPFISGVTYRHSGFGVHGGYVLAVPRRQDAVIFVKGVIHPRGELLWFGKPETDPNCVQAGQVGWPMHESCWMIVDKFIGHENIENNIELFMNAFSQEHVRKCLDYRINGPLVEDTGLWEFLHKDPTHIPELHKVAQFAIENPFPIKYEPLYTDATRLRGIRASEGNFSKLPLDIALEIVQYLSAPDMRNIILTARWKFPDSYWKRKIPNCVFELHEIPPDKDVDWQYVGLEFLMMMEQQNGIHHRGRIVQYLARIYASCNGQSNDAVDGNGFVTYLDIPI